MSSCMYHINGTSRILSLSHTCKLAMHVPFPIDSSYKSSSSWAFLSRSNPFWSMHPAHRCSIAFFPSEWMCSSGWGGQGNAWLHHSWWVGEVVTTLEVEGVPWDGGGNIFAVGLFFSCGGPTDGADSSAARHASNNFMVSSAEVGLLWITQFFEARLIVTTSCSQLVWNISSSISLGDHTADFNQWVTLSCTKIWPKVEPCPMAQFSKMLVIFFFKKV